MAYVNEINVQGTTYDVNDKRLPEANGKVTLNAGFEANEIVEKMSGYSFSDVSENYCELTYAGVVKNGNKITFAIAGIITNPTEYSTHIGLFGIPASVGNKLFKIGSTDYLAFGSSSVKSGPFGDTKYCEFGVEKVSNETLQVYLFALNNAGLTAGTPYYFRFEITFLLSDNLVQ